MNFLRKDLTAFFLLFFLSYFTSISPAVANEITIRSDEWYPYNGDPSSDRPGYMIEVLSTIFEPLGYAINYRLMPWERSVIMVEKGSFDCLVGVTKEESPSLIYPKEVLGVDTSLFYVHVDSDWTYLGEDSLVGKKIGIIGGYEYGEAFDKFVLDNPKLIRVIKSSNALERHIQLLARKRTDIYIESPAVMEAKVKEMGMENLIKSAGEYTDSNLNPEENNLYFACSPNNPKSQFFADEFDKGIQALRASGELGKILSKYGLSDWVK